MSDGRPRPPEPERAAPSGVDRQAPPSGANGGGGPGGLGVPGGKGDTDDTGGNDDTGGTVGTGSAVEGSGGELTAAEWVEREEARLQGAARAMRGVVAGTLCMEAFTVALVPGVVAKFGSGLTALKLTLLLGLAVLLVAVAFLQRRPWGLVAASVLQLAVLACGLLTTAMYGLGGIFVLIWLYELRVRRELLTRRPPPPHLR